MISRSRWGPVRCYPSELTNAYATLATGGRYAPPVFLSHVQDRHGEKLLPSKTRLRQVVSPAVAAFDDESDALCG